MDVHATARPGIAWPFFVGWFLDGFLDGFFGLIALSLSGRFAAPSWPLGYYHEEKAT
jgi:hypothetical protein